MNILIIGNGFDKAHGLPTGYADFLSVCRKVRLDYIQEKEMRSTRSEGKSGDFERWNDFRSKVLDKSYRKFANNVKENFWVSYFMEKSDSIGDNWLNFEEEIKIVLNLFLPDRRISSSELAAYPSAKAPYNSSIYNFWQENDFFKSVPTYRQLFNQLLEEHKKLVCALEIYMDEYVSRIDVQMKTMISGIRCEKVLSFNYTRTYAEYYDSTVDFCFIHGKAAVASHSDKCDLVLGFDDHYIDDIKIEPELIPFEKYYQRIINQNDQQYFDWIDEMEKSSRNIVHIYGHSLAPSDGDVLRKFLLCKNTVTSIYCYDEVDRADKIRNLAVVLGPDNLIKLTSKQSASINFVMMPED